MQFYFSIVSVLFLSVSHLWCIIYVAHRGIVTMETNSARPGLGLTFGNPRVHWSWACSTPAAGTEHACKWQIFVFHISWYILLYSMLVLLHFYTIMPTTFLYNSRIWWNATQLLQVYVTDHNRDVSCLCGSVGMKLTWAGTKIVLHSVVGILRNGLSWACQRSRVKG